MATEIVHWCDVHLANDERHPVVARHTVTVDGTALVVELCEACEVAVFKPFAGFLADYAVPERVAGKPVKVGKVKPASTAAPARVSAAADGRHVIEVEPSSGRPLSDHTLYPCLICEGVVEGRNPFDRHLRDAHGTSSGNLYGLACPLCDYTSAAVQGLAAHGRSEHTDGHGGLFELFDLARREGDPRGVVAARLAGLSGA